MKNIKRLLFAITASAALFAGCSLMDSASVSDDDYVSASKMISMTGSVGSEAGDVRTITPEIDAKSYNYYITGKTSTGIQYTDSTDKTKKISQVTLDTDGKFELPILSAAWEFTLVAIDSSLSAPTDPDTITATASLVAYAYADLLKSSSTVTFTLTPNGLTGQGTVSLTLFLSNDSDPATDTNKWEMPDGYSARAELQDLITGATLSWVGGSTTGTGVTFDTSTTPAISKKSKSTVPFGGAGSNMDPGTYNFVVTFSKTGVPDSVWSDTLVVLPTKQTHRNVFIPNILGKAPADVTTFNAYRVESSEDLAERPDFYLAHFEWDAPNVNNERYFEIELGELASTCAVDDFSDDSKWNANVTSYKIYAAEGTEEPVASAARTMIELRKTGEYYDGSLLANRTAVTMFVPLGKAFTARIRAVNNIGVSPAWKYVTLPTAYSVIPAGPTTSGGQVPGSAWKKNLGSKAELANKQPVGFTDGGSNAASAINRFRITYDLNGGKYAVSKTGATETFTNKNVVRYYNLYKFASRTVVPFWAANANPNDGDLTALTNNGSYFMNWSNLAIATSTSKIYKPVTAKTTIPATAGDAASVKADAANGLKQTTAAQIKAMHDKFYSDPNDPGTILSTGKPKSSALEGLDDGGYIGFDNLYLYADYSAVIDATATKEDTTADYFLATDWVKIKSYAAAGAIGTAGKALGDNKLSDSSNAKKPEVTGGITISKASEENTGAVKLYFGIELPTTGYYIDTDLLKDTPTGSPARKQYTLAEETKTAKVTLTIMDAQKVVYYTSNGTLTTGAIDNLGDFDVNSWENGKYTAYINMTSTKGNAKPVTTSVRITMTIQD